MAGGVDALWPSEPFAQSIADRFARFGKNAVVASHPEAGHRVLLPGETTPRSTRNAHGGSYDADLALGRSAWAALLVSFGGRPELSPDTKVLLGSRSAAPSIPAGLRASESTQPMCHEPNKTITDHPNDVFSRTRGSQVDMSAISVPPNEP